ncbi:MAG: cysteine--tRNA ligase [Candidatus Doudnabacteria bacterium]|nr:cysteine--tRNA ligase [Candidatus Doudnabacteria bacterium]
MKLYNTLTRKAESLDDFYKLHGTAQTLNMYSCGPTVYNYAHIGNFRSYLFTDTLVRTLDFLGIPTLWAMNITDVDDKTIRDTLKEFGDHATVDNLRTFTSQYLDIYFSELRLLNIDPNHIRIIRVADAIPQIQEFILKLMDKGYAYTTEDGVFFSIEKYQTDFGDYGELVGKKFLEGKQVGARVKVDDYEKENLSDFALWKKHTEDDGQIFWDHPTLGKGRPGWHIECSVINHMAFQGAQTDIHTGGIDLIFPHHTNEIAQSQPFHKPFARHWAHCDHLLVDGKKMAKRDGNYVLLKDLIDKGPLYPLAFRYLCLQTDFRKPFNFTQDSLQAAKTALERLHNHVDELKSSTATGAGNLNQYNVAFRSALEDDLNIPKALAVLWEAVGDNTLPAEGKYALLLSFDEVLGLGLADTRTDEVNIPTEVQALISARETARANKDFSESDRLRGEIEKAGFSVLDTKDGQVVRAK